MSATTYEWLVLAFPLAGSLVIACGYKRLAGVAGWIATAAIGLVLPLRDRRADRCCSTTRRTRGS